MPSRPLISFFRVISVLMLLVAVTLISAIVTISFAIHGAEVHVPALKGMTVAQARSETAGLGLNLEVDNRYYSGEVAAGHILTQSPDPGAVVRRAWHVRVAESLGPQQVDVPDTVGTDERVAELTLRRAGLEVTQPAAHLPYANATEGAVLAQDPPAHAQDIAKPTVGLLVAAPTDELPDGYVMPDFTGSPATAVLATLAKAGIHAAPVQYVNVVIPAIGADGTLPAPPVAPGAVLAQSPPAGTRIDQTTIVKLSVAH
jgi:beta-lactam-binding protein with PASTA domain